MSNMRTKFQMSLDTDSRNNILPRYTTVARRYVKTNLGILICARADLLASNQVAKSDAYEPETLEVYLRTNMPDDWMPNKDLPFRYNDNVIELYSQEDIQTFEMLNKRLIADSKLAIFDASVDYVWAFSGQFPIIDETTHKIIGMREGYELREQIKPFAVNIKRANIKRG